MNNQLWFEKKSEKSIYIYMAMITYLLIIFVSLHCANLIYQGESFFSALSGAMSQAVTHPLAFLPITKGSLKAVGIGTVIFGFVALFAYTENEKNKRDAVNKESGSATFTNNIKEYNINYTSPIGEKTQNNENLILTDDVCLSLSTKDTRLNLNVMVIGGSGSGKSRFYVKPNLAQANTSYVVTDPAGELLESMGTFLEEQGYKVAAFNLTDMQHSCCYNPFDYIRNEEGVPMLVNCLIKNTTPAGAQKGDPFWEKSETALLSALFSFLIEAYPGRRDVCNFTSVMGLLRMAEVDENNPRAESKLDLLMADLAKKKGNTSMAVKDYTTFKMGAGKTLKSILISCAVRLHAFDLPGVANLVRTDMEHPENNLNLATLGDEKTALFVIIPAADDTYNFIVSMLYYQLFETLYYKAENLMPRSYIVVAEDGSRLTVRGTRREAEELIESFKKASIEKNDKKIRITDDDGESVEKILPRYAITCPCSKNEDGKKILWESPYEETTNKKLMQYKSAKAIKGVNLLAASGKTLAIPVNFFLDEFANIGQIPDFDKKLATLRKYSMSCSIILQNLAQLEEMYDKKAKGIIGNCDEVLFLGSSEYETCEYFSKKLGDATITVRNNSRSVGKSKGGQGGANFSYNKTARKLLTPDEVSLVQKNCLLFIRGMRPFYRKKYRYEKHPNYIHTGDKDPSRVFYCREHFNNEIHMDAPDSEAEKDKIISEECRDNLEFVKETAQEKINAGNADIINLDEEAMKEISDMTQIGLEASKKYNVEVAKRDTSNKGGNLVISKPISKNVQKGESCSNTLSKNKNSSSSGSADASDMDVFEYETIT